MAARLLDGFDGVVLVVSRLAQFEQVAVSEDRGQGGAQLVGHPGEIFAFGLAGRLGLVFRAAQVHRRLLVRRDVAVDFKNGVRPAEMVGLQGPARADI